MLLLSTNAKKNRKDKEHQLCELMCKKSVPKRLLLPTCLFRHSPTLHYVTWNCQKHASFQFTAFCIYFQQSVSSSSCFLKVPFQFILPFSSWLKLHDALSIKAMCFSSKNHHYNHHPCKILNSTFRNTNKFDRYVYTFWCLCFPRKDFHDLRQHARAKVIN